MAVSWSTTITPVNVATFEASIVAVRTETDESEQVISTDSYTVPRAKIKTQAEKLAVAQELWAKREEDVAENTAVENFVSAAEQSCNDYLEGQE